MLFDARDTDDYDRGLYRDQLQQEIPMLGPESPKLQYEASGIDVPFREDLESIYPILPLSPQELQAVDEAVATLKATPVTSKDSLVTSPTLRKHLITETNEDAIPLPELHSHSPAREGKNAISPRGERLPPIRQLFSTRFGRQSYEDNRNIECESNVATDNHSSPHFTPKNVSARILWANYRQSPTLPSRAVVQTTGYKCDWSDCAAPPFQTQYLLRYLHYLLL